EVVTEPPGLVDEQIDLARGGERRALDEVQVQRQVEPGPLPPRRHGLAEGGAVDHHARARDRPLVDAAHDGVGDAPRGAEGVGVDHDRHGKYMPTKGGIASRGTSIPRSTDPPWVNDT